MCRKVGCCCSRERGVEGLYLPPPPPQKIDISDLKLMPESFPSKKCTSGRERERKSNLSSNDGEEESEVFVCFSFCHFTIGTHMFLPVCVCGGDTKQTIHFLCGLLCSDPSSASPPSPPHHHQQAAAVHGKRRRNM